MHAPMTRRRLQRLLLRSCFRDKAIVQTEAGDECIQQAAAEGLQIAATLGFPAQTRSRT